VILRQPHDDKEESLREKLGFFRCRKNTFRCHLREEVREDAGFT